MAIPEGLISALAVQAAVTILVPILLLIWWQKRHHRNVLPMVMGLMAFVIFAQVLETILHYACLIGNNPISRALNGNPLLYALYGGLAAGLFEETGRFMAFSYPLRRFRDRRDAISYGIGHGGYECIAIAGGAALSYLVLALFLKSGYVPVLMEAFSETEAEVVRSVLDQVAGMNPQDCWWGIIERLAALVLQLSLSVLVFASVAEPERCGKLYLLAIVLHAAADFPAGLYQSGAIQNIPLTELAVALLTVVTAAIALRVWKMLADTETASNT